MELIDAHKNISNPSLWGREGGETIALIERVEI
jgi:hypothetical protein